MMRTALHYGFAALAAACFLAFILLGAALPQFLDSDRPLDDKLTTFFTPSRRRTDFVGHVLALAEIAVAQYGARRLLRAPLGDHLTFRTVSAPHRLTPLTRFGARGKLVSPQ